MTIDYGSEPPSREGASGAGTPDLPPGVSPEQADTLPPTVPADPAPGTPLGSRYVLDTVIGSGATGRVWRARRRADDTPIAVKVLRGDFTGDPDAVVRFLRQRTVLHALGHPHLVRVHDLVAEGDVLAIVMDLIEGEDLRRLAARRALRVDQQLTVLGQVADALAAVHAASVVHRDVKPENVLVTWQNAKPFALLTDFGVARVADGAQLTRMSQLVGTPAYVAPELVAGRAAGPPADLYALGVTLYEVLAGRRPFQAEHPAALLRAHLEVEPARPPGLTDRLWELVRSCLAKEPADRPNAADIAADLLALGEQGRQPPLPIPPAPPSLPPPPSSPSSPSPLPPPPPSPLPPGGGAAGEDVQVRGEDVQPSAGEIAVAGGDVAAAQYTTGATRPAPPAPAAAPPRRRRHRPWVMAIAACVLLGTGTGLWAGRPAPNPPPKSAPGPTAARYHTYYLPVTATSPSPGEILLHFSDASEMAGFQYYVVFRNRDVIGQPAPDQAPPYSVPSVDSETRHCWTVAALLETDRPPPSAPAKPACKTADGRSSEN
jgi:serine/threonine-protein kinase